MKDKVFCKDCKKFDLLNDDLRCVVVIDDWYSPNHEVEMRCQGMNYKNNCDLFDPK